jgi:hypothetical protein
MHDALGQLNGPVSHEALRLRMVALHGREDALLGPPRFLRLLRQANDAEIADVRQVSEGEYEVAPHRLDAAQPAPRSQPPAPKEPTAAAPPPDAAPAEVEADGRNGQRFGIRFRRGSRGAVRMADVPLIGVVHVDAPDPVVEVAEPVVEAAVTTPAGRKRARGVRKRASSPKAKAAKPAAAPAAAKAEPGPQPVLADATAAEEAPAAAPRRRARPRARRKAE